MCTATDGATPVYLCTWAASSIFSSGVRGTPGWANTLNRVPLFPNAHDGSSIWWFLSAFLTAIRSGIWVVLLSEVKDFGDPQEGLVGRAAGDEELRHLRLPALVDLGRRHRVERSLIVLGLQVADKETVVAEEQRVVPP